MYAVDLHAHSRFFHGFEGRSTTFDPIGARLLTAVAARRGMDAVALTNHDYRYVPTERGPATPERAEGPAPGVAIARNGAAQSGPVETQSGARSEPAEANGDARSGTTETNGGDPEAARRSAPVTSGASDADPIAIPGIEITTTRGHLLVVGPDPPEFVTPGTLTPDEAIDLAHDRGCAAIIPHPFRASTVRETDATVDAVEVNGKHTDHRERVALLAEERDCPIVGGSDAHYPVEVGRAYTRVDADELTPTSVVAAIRDGRVEPAVHEYPLDRVLTPAYRAIHRIKGQLSAEDGTGS